MYFRPCDHGDQFTSVAFFGCDDFLYDRWLSDDPCVAGAFDENGRILKIKHMKCP